MRVKKISLRLLILRLLSIIQYLIRDILLPFMSLKSEKDCAIKENLSIEQEVISLDKQISMLSLPLLMINKQIKLRCFGILVLLCQNIFLRFFTS